MKAFVAVLCLVACASAGTIVNSNHASNNGVINNSNTIHREARYMASLNQALNTVAGGNEGPQYHSHHYGDTKIISNKNVLHPGSSGSIHNNNGIHRRSVDSEEAREGRRMIANANRASNGGVVNNKNLIVVHREARRMINNANHANNGGVINNSNVIHREARYINNANHANNGGVINNENIHHREARDTHPHAIMLHAMHLAAHTKGRTG